MELRTLEYYLAVVREENITRAADVLHMTQPTLSRQMAQLEEELGTQLFVRGRHLTLTDAGIMLRRRAEEVVSLIEKIESEFEENNEVAGVISIGSGGLAASKVMPAVMEDFRKQYPQVQYEFYTNSAEFVKERLEQGLLDFGILMEPIDVTKFEYIRLKEREQWGLFMRSDHPLAQKETISKEDILSVPIGISERHSIQQELRNWFGEDFQRLNVYATFNLINNAALLVEQGSMCALTIAGAVEFFDAQKFVFRPVEPALTTGSVLAWKKFQTNVGAAGKFLAYFQSKQQKVCAECMKEYLI